MGESVTVTGDDAHHIGTVLRLRAGHFVELCDSSAAVYRAELVQTGRELIFELREECTAPSLPRLEITLAQCLPKGAKMDYVVEKATELGVARIIPVQSSRVVGERHGAATRLERWRRIVRAAAEQSRARRIPAVDEPVSWETLTAAIPQYDRSLIAWEVAPARPRELDTLLAGAAGVLIVIGPEGGLSRDEVEAARAQGAVPFSLGTRILRTETAGLVAAALAYYAAGEI